MRYNPSRSPLAAAALLLVLSATVVKPSALLEPPACKVWFEFGDDRLATYLGSEALDSQACVIKDIVDILHRRFGYWAFQAGTSQSVPRVEVTLEPSTALNIRVRLISRTNRLDQTWADELKPPGERQLTARPGPAATTVCADIKTAFEKLLDNGLRQTDIEKFLEHDVPLLCGVDPPRAPLLNTTTAVPGATSQMQAVLPLDWGVYHNLCGSVFTIECRAPNNEIVTLRSKGTGQCLAFPGETRPLRGVIVTHNEWVSSTGKTPISSHKRSEISSLSLKAILLEEEDFVYSSSDCDMPAPAMVAR